MNESVAIQSADFWVKVVEMLQQNWAVIEAEGAEAVRVYFINDASGVFDEIAFPSASAAREALGRNGFRRFAENSDLQSFVRPPSAPFRRAAHPNGPIYSFGRFWRS
jgi:hypothetical protein